MRPLTALAAPHLDTPLVEADEVGWLRAARFTGGVVLGQVRGTHGP